MASLAEPLQGGPYPDPDDDADIPNDMKAIVDWAAERSVMRFTSTSDRNSKLPSPTEGMLCVTGTGTTLTVWLYRNSAWREIPIPGVDGTPYRMASGSIVINSTVGGVATGTATFPTGRFSAAPVVTTNAITTSPHIFMSACPSTTTSGASLRLSDTRTSGSSAAVTVQWVAIQMTPSSATG